MSRFAMSWWIGLVMVGGVAGCGDSTPGDSGGTTSPPPPGSVLADTSPASAADCPDGGTVVRGGTDDNHNQKLDDSEVRTRTVVCNPEPAQPPPKIVVRIIGEPLGSTACIEGGSAVQSGPDTNGNGALDDEEVTDTRLLCGELLTTRFRTEPAGANCPAGGVAFELGHDRNGNAVLDSGEVEHTNFSCGEILAQSIDIASDDDAATLAHIRIIDGDLRSQGDPIFGSRLTAAALPELQRVTGFVNFSFDPVLTQLSLPKLVDVRGALLLRDDPLLTTVELPLLNSVGKEVELSGLPALADMKGLPNLGHAGSAVTIHDNAALTAARVPSDVSGDLEVSNNPALAQLSISCGPDLKRVMIAHNGITSLSLSIRSLPPSEGFTPPAGPVAIEDNPALASATIRADALGALTIAGNPVLGAVDLSLAQGDGDIVLNANPMLNTLSLFSSAFPPLGGPIHLAGSLRILDPIAQLITLSALVVDGDFDLENSQLTRVSVLRNVGGDLILQNNPRLLDLDIVLEVGGDLIIARNAAMRNVSFVENEVYRGNVVVSHNDTLVNLQGLNAARTIHGNLDITDNPALVLTGTRGITRIDGNVTIGGNAVLTDLGLDQLQSADLFELNDNPMLSAIALPALQSAGDMIAIGNPVAQHLVMSALAFAQSLFVQDNPQLPSCEVLAFQPVVADPIVQSGNDDTKVCTPDGGGTLVR